MNLSNPRALYAAFDRFPSRKGAAVHIDRFARALFARTGNGLLYVLGGDGLPPYQREDNLQIVRFCRETQNLLDRALSFGARLSGLLDRVETEIDVCHFRDPWSGIPIVARSHRYASVYEVNGLPSIELPFAYPDMGPETLRKIRRDEERCWTEADAVVVPAASIRETLIRLGCDAAKISVIPNGADSRPTPARPADAPTQYLLYFGAVQPWQGIDTLLRAMARLLDVSDLRLVLCVSRMSREVRRYQRLAETLGVADKLLWKFALPEEELAPWRAHALASVAPLALCERNLEQGCSPLKILESMADGVPVVASDIPSVREIVTDDVDGRLVPANRPSELARALRLLIDYPDQRNRLGTAARATIQKRFTWERSIAALNGVYDRLSVKGRPC